MKNIFNILIKYSNPQEIIAVIFIMIIASVRWWVQVPIIPSSIVIKILVLALFLIFIFLALIFPMLDILYQILKTDNTQAPKYTLRDFIQIYRDFLPFFLIFMAYHSLGVQGSSDLVHIVNNVDYAPQIIKAENQIIGFQASQATQAIITPILTDIMYIIYGFPYPLPIILAFLIYWKKDKKIFNDYMLALVLTLAVGFILFFFFPTSPPRFMLSYDISLYGGDITSFAGKTLKVATTAERSAFPSIHAALPTVMLLAVLKYPNKIRIPISLIVASIYFSTIYLRHHYIIDLFAGGLLSVICFIAAISINNNVYFVKKIS